MTPLREFFVLDARSVEVSGQLEPRSGEPGFEGVPRQRVEEVCPAMPRRA